MNPILFARAMRARGWRYARRCRGEALFGIRFPNGRGSTLVVSIEMIAACQAGAAVIADHHTRGAALSAGFDLRGALS